MQEFLTNPWVVIFIVLSIIIGNLAALKYVSKIKIGQTNKRNTKSDLDKLIELDKKNHQRLSDDD